MMLTSTKNTDPSVDISIRNLADTGLPKPTVARTSRLFTLKSSIVNKRIGKIADQEFKTIVDKLIQLLSDG